jgi:hypothetical protein
MCAKVTKRSLSNKCDKEITFKIQKQDLANTQRQTLWGLNQGAKGRRTLQTYIAPIQESFYGFEWGLLCTMYVFIVHLTFCFLI